MGLTRKSVGKKANEKTFKYKAVDYTVALAGNPNVGKSTIFNGITGMNQHTGNWAGKTVTNAIGYADSDRFSYKFVDIPGTYSLHPHSAEETVARDYLCIEKPDAVIVVCDATCLERNMNLVLQIMEISVPVILCINLIDEAKKKGIQIDTELIQNKLGIPVITTVGRKKKTLSTVISELDKLMLEQTVSNRFTITYPQETENAVSYIMQSFDNVNTNGFDKRWLSLRILENDENIIEQVNKKLGFDIMLCDGVKQAINLVKYTSNLKFNEIIAAASVRESENICRDVIKKDNNLRAGLDKKLDKIFTSKLTGYPIMIVLLGLVFWITISLANYPSEWLTKFFAFIKEYLDILLLKIHTPSVIKSIISDGIYRVLTWVIAVMLPPMAIFFPLFTLLEDSGYLPRIAYNLDKPFKSCNACGKQALTMCMGFGCNAAGVVGCRIIDSKRERLLATLTNCFVPCNGRFPTIITVISMFCLYGVTGKGISFLYAAILMTFIIIAILITFVVTKILSKTLLKGEPSSYILEMPPYRKPQVLKVIIRSVFDRTVFMLGRAAAIAAPSGLIIWLMANIVICNKNLLNICATFLDPFAALLGMDGILLIAFILGSTANEIVMPIALMGYMSSGNLSEINDISVIREILIQNGWTWLTAVNVILFTLIHWPCMTTLMTIKKETGSIKWTLLGMIVPTVTGVAVCMIFTFIVKLFLKV